MPAPDHTPNTLSSQASALLRLKEALAKLTQRAMNSRVGRMQLRYSAARGSLLAGGIAYQGLFSLFGAMAISVSLFLSLLSWSPALQSEVISSLSRLIPGVLDDGSGTGLISLSSLENSSPVNLGSIVGVAVLGWGALGLMACWRSSVQAMFGIVTLKQNWLLGQLINLAGFLVIAVAVIVTAAATLVSSRLLAQATFLPDVFRHAWTSWGAIILSFLLDATVVPLLIRLAGPRVPRADIVKGALIAGVMLGATRLAGASVVGSLARNPMLASFAALLTVVLWLHVMSRALLYLCAWIANPPAPEEVEHPELLHVREYPNYVTLSAPHTLGWPRQSLTGAVEVDPSARPES